MMCLCRASRWQYPACCGDYARFAWPPTEATKGRLGYGQPFWRRKVHNCRGFAIVHSVPEFQECALNTAKKARGAVWMGFDRCQQTCVQNTAQDYLYRESERRVSNKGAMIYACRASVLHLSNW